MEQIDQIDRFVEQIDVGRALILVPSWDEAKIIKSSMMERDYPCGSEFSSNNRFVILPLTALDVVNSMTVFCQHMNVIFLFGICDMYNALLKTKTLLDPRMHTYILSLS